MSGLVSKCGLSMISIAIVVLLSSCAALRPPSANGPRSTEPAYPIVLANDAGRLETVTAAWHQLAESNGLPQTAEPRFQPLTATVQSLPDASATAVVLPKVGDNPLTNEDDIRESLKRFIIAWKPLIGAEPSQLSLLERTDEPSGIKLAKYEQRPFRYPLRGDFGNLIIRFRTDRRVVGLSSNCLPNTDRVQATLLGLSPRVTREDVPSILRNNTITVGVNGGQQTLTLTTNNSIEPRQLVVYAVGSPDGAGVELHLAWEIDVTNGPIKTIYLDAMTGKVIATSNQNLST